MASMPSPAHTSVTRRIVPLTAPARSAGSSLRRSRSPAKIVSESETPSSLEYASSLKRSRRGRIAVCLKSGIAPLCMNINGPEEKGGTPLSSTGSPSVALLTAAKTVRALIFEAIPAKLRSDHNDPFER